MIAYSPNGQSHAPSLGDGQAASIVLDADSISARLDRLPASPDLWWMVARLSFGAFFEIYETALTGLLPVTLVAAGVFAKDRTGLFGLPDLATFAFATFAGLFIGALGAAWISDKVGRRPVFIWSVVWYAAATFAMLFQHDAAALCELRLIGAVGVGASIVTIDAYLVEALPQRLRGRGFAISKSIQYLAVPSAGLLAMATAHHTPLGVAGWRWLLLLPVLAGGLVFLIARNLPESPRWLATQGRPREAFRIVEAMEAAAAARGLKLPPPTPAAVAPMDSGQFGDLFRAPLLGRMAMMVVTSCCATIAYFGFGNWLPSLLEARHVEVTKSLLYVTLISLSYPLAPLVFSRWADAFERKTQLICGSLITMAAGLAFAVQGSAAGWLATGLLLTVGNNLSSYAAHTYRSELFPSGLRARAIGLVYSIDRLTAAFSSYLIGFLFVRGGVDWVLGCIVGFSWLSIVVIGLFGPRTAARSTNATRIKLAKGSEP